MLKSQLLNKLKEKHPEYTKAQINLVISRRISLMVYKIIQSNVFDITVRKFGRIHTHGNKKNLAKINKNERIRKFVAKKIDYSDKNLLF